MSYLNHISVIVVFGTIDMWPGLVGITFNRFESSEKSNNLHGALKEARGDCGNFPTGSKKLA